MLRFHYGDDVAEFNMWVGNGRVDVEFPTGYAWRPRLAWLMAEISAAFQLDPARTNWWLANGRRLTIAFPTLYWRRVSGRWRLART